MNDSAQISRRLAVLILSEERGRSSDHPLDPSLISKWAADLGLQRYGRYFSMPEMAALRAVNAHYAGGGTRQELLEKLKQMRIAG